MENCVSMLFLIGVILSFVASTLEEGTKKSASSI